MIDLDHARDPAKLPTDELLAYLAEIAADLEATLGRSDQLYELRRAVFIAARNRSPQVTLTTLSAASGASVASVTQVLFKARQQRTNAKAGG